RLMLDSRGTIGQVERHRLFFKASPEGRERVWCPRFQVRPQSTVPQTVFDVDSGTCSGEMQNVRKPDAVIPPRGRRTLPELPFYLDKRGGQLFCTVQDEHTRCSRPEVSQIKGMPWCQRTTPIKDNGLQLRHRPGLLARE